MFIWKELVAMGLLDRLSDPGLVIHVMGVVKPMRRDFLEEEAREFHVGQRIDKEERWKKTKDLSKARKFSHMNACVPITCTLPFDGGMWRRSCELLKTIRLFRETFLREEDRRPLTQWSGPPEREQRFSGKIQTVNMFLDDTFAGIDFRRGWTLVEIKEALNDLEVFDEPPVDFGYDLVEIEEKPYVLVKRMAGRRYIDIIN